MSDTKCECCGKPVVPGSMLCRLCLDVDMKKGKESIGMGRTPRGKYGDPDSDIMDEAAIVGMYRAMTNNQRMLVKAAMYLITTSSSLAEGIIFGAMSHTVAQIGAEMGRKIGEKKKAKAEEPKKGVCLKVPPCSHPYGSACGCPCHYAGYYKP